MAATYDLIVKMANKTITNSGRNGLLLSSGSVNLFRKRTAEQADHTLY